MPEDNKVQLPSEYLESRPELVEGRISILKASISLVPYVGSAINEILFELPNRIQQSRINETVGILEKKFKALDQLAISKEYIESADFFDFTRTLFEESLKIGSQEKREMLSEIYTSAIETSENFERGRSGLFMRFVSEMHPEQIRILQFIESKETELNQIGTYRKFFDLYNGLLKELSKGQYDFKYYCSDLENKSLISLGAGLDDFRSKSGYLALESHEEASVTLTELGHAFLVYLKK
jgi:hypothetical protein